MAFPKDCLRPNRQRISAAILLYAWFVFLTLATTFGTLSLAYFSDDLDHLHRVTEFRSGEIGLTEFLLRPHNDQTLPTLRAMYWLSSLYSGSQATALRVMVVAAHAAGALACAMLIFFLTRSHMSAWFGGSVYAAAGGYIASIVWAPSNAIFCLGAVGLAFCFVSLASPLENRRLAFLLSFAAALFAVGGMNGTSVGLLAVPVFCRLWRVQLPMSASRAGFLFVGLGAIVLAVARWNTARIEWHPTISLNADTIAAALWFPFSAAGRFALSWWIHNPQGVYQITAVAAVAWIFLIGSLGSIDRKKWLFLGSLWVAPVMVGCLVAVGRAHEKLGPLYVTDRYYYFFLLPLSVQIALLADAARAFHSRVVFVLIALLTLGIVGSRSRYLASIPQRGFQDYERVLTQGRDLVNRIARASRPVELANGRIPFENVPQNELSLRFLLFAQFPRGLAGVNLATRPLPAAASASQNTILDEWAAANGLQASPACVLEGRLQASRPHSWLDFGLEGYPDMIVHGFYARQDGFRFIAHAAILRLRTAPGVFVVRAVSPVEVRVRVEIAGETVSEILCDAGGDRDFEIPFPRSEARDGREVLVRLTADRIWRPSEKDPSNLDSRTLSIGVRAIGFQSAAGAPLPSCTALAASHAND